MGKLQEVLSGLKQITGKAASSAVKATTQKVATEKKDDSLWGKLKSFAKSDTGKALGMAAGTIAAGKYGGAQGINALSSAIERSRMREKEEAAEAERKKDLDETRNLRKLNTVRAELDIDRTREALTADRMKNKYPERENRSDWELMNTRAVEPDETSAGVKAAVGKVKSGTEPKLPQPPQPTPVSIDDPKAVQKGEIDAAQWAAKVIQKMDQLEIARGGTPLSGSGQAEFVKNRELLNQELQGSGLTKEQQAAAWKEMSRLIVGPEYFSQYEAMQNMRANPNYTPEEKSAVDETNLFKTMTSFPGPIVRGMLGATGTEEYLPDYDVFGQGARDSMQDAAGKAWDGVTSFFSGQADATSTPAVAGANKSAADNMATYEDDNRYAMQIARGLERTGAGPQDTDQIMAQLSQIPSIAENKERRDKIIKLVRWHFSQKPEPASQWMNERAWR